MKRGKYTPLRTSTARRAAHYAPTFKWNRWRPAVNGATAGDKTK